MRTGMRAVQDPLVAHCHVSGRPGQRVGLDPGICDALDQTFTRRDGKGVPRGLGGDRVALPMQICQMDDGIEVWHREEGVQVAVLRACDQSVTSRSCGRSLIKDQGV